MGSADHSNAEALPDADQFIVVVDFTVLHRAHPYVDSWLVALTCSSRGSRITTASGCLTDIRRRICCNRTSLHFVINGNGHGLGLGLPLLRSPSIRSNSVPLILTFIVAQASKLLNASPGVSNRTKLLRRSPFSKNKRWRSPSSTSEDF